jgi:hypothetical protein
MRRSCPSRGCSDLVSIGRPIDANEPPVVAFLCCCLHACVLLSLGEPSTHRGPTSLLYWRSWRDFLWRDSPLDVNHGPPHRGAGPPRQLEAQGLKGDSRWGGRGLGPYLLDLRRREFLAPSMKLLAPSERYRGGTSNANAQRSDAGWVPSEVASTGGSSRAGRVECWVWR